METEQTINVSKIRKDFPILGTKVHNYPLVYLDNGATSLTPSTVTKAMNTYYQEWNANIHRSVHTLSEKATEAYEAARKSIATFLNAASWKEIIFTNGTTEALNMLAHSLTENLEKGDEIVLTEMEHHSNLVPWQQRAKEKGLVLKFIKVNKEGRLDEESIQETITNKTKIVSITYMSNVLGTINEVKKIGKLAHERGALFIIDAAQAVPHLPVDVQALECDYLAFSGHKMCGPTGIGVLYAKRALLERMHPFQYGGDMIAEVQFTNATWNDIPWKFEAGTPNIAEAIGLGAAITYLQAIGMENIKEYEEMLTEYALEKLHKIGHLTFYGPQDTKERGGVISFSIKGVHSHDISAILDQQGIAVRGGHLCAMPLVTQVLKADDVCRASFYVYNTLEEVDKLVEGIKRVKEIFKVC